MSNEKKKTIGGANRAQRWIIIELDMVADDATLLEMGEDRSMSKGGVDAGPPYRFQGLGT